MEVAASADRAKRMPEERRRGKREAKIVPNASVRNARRKQSGLCPQRASEKNVCAPAEIRQRKAVSERPRRTSADGSRAGKNAGAVAKADAQNEERAVSAK